ncbi:Uncharacterised protein [Mycobacterium tuberculosis]|uniref:Uncharacterized protein n=1 Tax=Mycobacterium tuberculosis TaxID=1773 RepID=A0A0T9G0M6_MYCTX|nr:Uncharacterised protein [Mycobacterium tuberculosis]CFE49744.1 Uncharacterised protein [Mycobacterium tuberculosis]CFR73628.1 Uncharacterised protein [Mycobacterium tuberculosis]CKO29146.1 Uncharacterised protein [Mycobacterium tuberculosis]CKR24367.1 Uncharacterised protein [Mycobacterium tuberculosis]
MCERCESSRLSIRVRCVQLGNGASTKRPSGYWTEKSTLAPALCTSATKPRNPNGSCSPRRIAASVAIGMSRLAAFCSTA